MKSSLVSGCLAESSSGGLLTVFCRCLINPHIVDYPSKQRLFMIDRRVSAGENDKSPKSIVVIKYSPGHTECWCLIIIIYHFWPGFIYVFNDQSSSKGLRNLSINKVQFNFWLISTTPLMCLLSFIWAGS